MRSGAVASAAGRFVLAGALAAVAVTGLVVARLWPDDVARWGEHILSAVRAAGPLGWLGFALLQAGVAASGILPASLLGIAAGTLYGLWLGFALAAVSSLAGAVLAFVLARWLLRAQVAAMLSRQPRLRNMDATVARDGWRFVCLLRISPVMPFAATSYALGLSSVSLRDYLLGTCASLPALLGYVFLGTLAQAGLSAWASGASTVHWALLAAGVVATVLLTARIGQLAMRALPAEVD